MSDRRWAGFGVCILGAMVLGSLIGCGSGDGETAPPTASISEPGVGGRSDEAKGSSHVDSPVVLTAQVDGTTHATHSPADLRPEVVIRTSLGDIRVELDAENAPDTVENFLSGYVDRGFYTGTIFHHVDRGFIIAAGGYTSDLEAKEVRAPIRNESDNGLSNSRGTIAMARLPDYPDSATSQFFINVDDNPMLDHQGDGATFGYCVFGHVIEGMDVVDRIAAVDVEENEKFPRHPKQPVVINAIERVNK